MNQSIITQSLKDLAVKRPFFWSEADFQFAFSEALRVYLPNAKIRLERPVPIKKGKDEKTYHVDIWIEDEGKIYPIELKYKTKRCSIKIGDETFNVTDQSAEDLGRYDYIADIKRIEDIRDLYRSTFGEGYAIMLTNNLRYCPNERNNKNTMDKNFRIYQGAVLKGQLKWIRTLQSKTVNEDGDRGSRRVISLSGEYQIKWEDYSKDKDTDGKEIFLRRCVTTITK